MKSRLLIGNINRSQFLPVMFGMDIKKGTGYAFISDEMDHGKVAVFAFIDADEERSLCSPKKKINAGLTVIKLYRN